VVPPKDGPFGVRTMSDIFGGNVPLIHTKRGVNRRFQAKLAKILQLTYHQNYYMHSNKIAQ